MANPHRSPLAGQFATWAYAPGTFGVDKNDAAAMAKALRTQEMTVEEALTIMNDTSSQISGFWNEQANRDCKKGKKMQDIDPALFPSSKGPRDV